MNFAVLTLTVEQTKIVDGHVKAKVTSYDSKGGAIPLIAYAYGRQGDRLAATPIGSSIVARCELKPGDKFSLLRVDIRAIIGEVNSPDVSASVQPISEHQPPVARPAPVSAPAPTTENFDEIPF